MEKAVRNFLIKILEQGQVSSSNISKTVKPKLSQLREAGFISWKKSGRGSLYTLKNSEGVKSLLKSVGYHGPTEGLTPKARAVADHGDAHSGRDDTLLIQLTTVNTDNGIWYKNGDPIETRQALEDFGVLSIAMRPEDKWEALDPIALVENIDLLIYAKKYFSKDMFKGNVIYYSGWANKRTIDWLKTQPKGPKIIFPDYDFVGLNNYLKLKKIFPGLSIYIPEGLPERIRRFGKRQQFAKQSQKYPSVPASREQDVQIIYSAMLKYGKTLDQESLLLRNFC